MVGAAVILAGFVVVNLAYGFVMGLRDLGWCRRIQQGAAVEAEEAAIARAKDLLQGS